MEIKWVVNFIISIIATPFSSIAYPLKQISIPLVRSCIKRMGVNKLFISFTTLYKSNSVNNKNLYRRENYIIHCERNEIESNQNVYCMIRW